MILKRQKNKSNRSLKVIEVIKKSISQILLKNDLPLYPNFQFPLSVVSVDLSSDLRIAYIYVSTHENIDDEEIVNRLDSCKKYISSEMNLLVDLKFMPKLIFRNDKQILSYKKINELLNSKKVQEDLKK
ncbi:ribosome-binding factor A [Pelagibacteraceae bacterium]|nr:ribosome-binding factor A [Pelagibacteraceae bacterium]